MNLNIKNKLIIGFTCILVMFILTTIFMGNQYSESNATFNKVVNVSAKKVNLSNQIMINVLQVTRYEKNIISEKDIHDMERYKDQLYQAFDTVVSKSKELREMNDLEGKQLLLEFDTIWKSFRPDLDQIVELSYTNHREKAFEISSTVGLKTRDAALNLMQKLIQKNEKSMLDDTVKSNQSYQSVLNLIMLLILLTIILIIGISYWIINSISKRINFISRQTERIASREYTDEELFDESKDEFKIIFNSLINVNSSFKEVTENANKVASGNYTQDFKPRSSKDKLGNALNLMTHSLKESTTANERHNWLNIGLNLLNEKLRGDQGVEELANMALGFIAEYLQVHIGTVYFFNEKENAFILTGDFAFSSTENSKRKFEIGEGLIGQAVREQKTILLSDLETEEMRVSSSILDTKPHMLMIIPVVLEGKSLAVIELGKLSPFTDLEQEFIRNAQESIAISFGSALSRKRILELLEETQVQSEELQSQQEELRQVNEELEEQAQNLKQQQEELQITNEELEEQTQSLELKNKEVEFAKNDIEQKTRQLEISSKYKSEFLANMSHELRTPLNSLLILSKDLSENNLKNLTEDQVDSAEIIYKSGTDLLILINEVLDLSKIEAGKMTLNIERISLSRLSDDLFREFKYQAEQKGLKMTTKLDVNLPEFIRTDSQRLMQILKNMLSNALKFTEKGSIEIGIERHGTASVVIHVSDTGIGIPEEKQQAVFEAFQQADGGTSRKYGGTGLGLSISRELAHLLKAEINLKSTVKEGSRFSLILPLEISGQTEVQREPSHRTQLPISNSHESNQFLNHPALEDDRNSLTSQDKIVLIVEDDLKFADILLKQAHKKGFKGLSASSGEDGLALAERYSPHAIILDIDLPGINGHQVLAELKANPSLRHIPVHIVSVNERSLEPIREGAIEYLMKPVTKNDLEDAFNRIEHFVSRKMKNLLIIEDDKNSRVAMRKLIGNGDVQCFEAADGAAALEIFEEEHIDCIVLDIGLPDMTGFELIYKLEKVKANIPPIIIYTGKELTRDENEELQKYAESIIIKGVKSEERLLDETALFLHRTIRNLPETKQSIIQGFYDKETIFQSKQILLVDDDMRNVFALSKILGERGMQVIKADNGLNALKMLEKHTSIDLVLMDIMMPEMDGYEAMKHIRSKDKFQKLPIIALTAKAMKDDKQKCIDAGANDYITKPVDINRLLSLMRVWLNK